MLKLKRKTKWRMVLMWLRREFPLPKKVQVRQVDIKELQGSCELVGQCFKIQICKRQCYNLRLDTLLHEWAHAQTWNGNDTDDHGSEWGLAYARLYRAYLLWYYGKGPSQEDEEEEEDH